MFNPNRNRITHERTVRLVQLIASDITVRFPGKSEAVLDHTDFVCSTGETVAILGPSGSGKSTLLSVLGGLLQPQEGAVKLLGNDNLESANVERIRGASSWILQTTNVFPERTAVDNVAIAAQMAGATRTAALLKGKDALNKVGLSTRINARTGVLSGGEVQRVVTARALVAGRPLYLLTSRPAN